MPLLWEAAVDGCPGYGRQLPAANVVPLQSVVDDLIGRTAEAGVAEAKSAKLARMPREGRSKLSPAPASQLVASRPLISRSMRRGEQQSSRWPDCVRYRTQARLWGGLGDCSDQNRRTDQKSSGPGVAPCGMVGLTESEVARCRTLLAWSSRGAYGIGLHSHGQGSGEEGWAAKRSFRFGSSGCCLYNSKYRNDSNGGRTCCRRAHT